MYILIYNYLYEIYKKLHSDFLYEDFYFQYDDEKST